MSLAKCARPQLAAVLAALTGHPPDRWRPSEARLDRVDTQGAWYSPTAWPATAAHIGCVPWIYPDPAEAWEVLHTRDIIPMDYRGQFICGLCERFHGEGRAEFSSCGRCKRVLRTRDPAGPTSHPTTLPDLIAWASIGFAARDDGSPGILAAEEMALVSQPCPFAWKVAPEPKWWRTVNTPNANRLRASGLSWWAADGRVVIAVPPL